VAKISVQLLSQEEKNKIHADSLTLLEEVGLDVLDAEAVDILADAGARADEGSPRVRFPPSLIEEWIAKAPSEFNLYGRDVGHVIHLQAGNVFYSTSGYAVHWYDSDSSTRRTVSQEDLAWITRLADGLDQMDVYAVVGTPVDAPTATNDRYQCAISMINTTKHFWNTAYGKEGVRDAVRMASMVRGSREALRRYPLFTLDMTTLSPLQLDGRQASTMIEGAREGIPIGISPGPIGGATGPVTMAGNVTQANAEVLGAITLCQIVQPGIPVVYTQWSRSLDMSSGQLGMGGPEFSMQRVATAEMARYYDLPSRGGGMMADAKAIDAQMGAEKMLNCLMSSLAGLNIVSGIGMVDITNTVCPEQMIIDNEIICMVRHILKGFEVTEETIPLDLIGEVGPGGNYLTTEHTLEHFRQELWFTKLWDRKPWTVWEKEGAMDVAERSLSMIKADKHVVPPLDEGVEDAIWEVVHKADQQYTSGGR
jgi:trimethylamine--corrinoid protein Co-methyltransferase